MCEDWFHRRHLQVEDEKVCYFIILYIFGLTVKCPNKKFYDVFKFIHSFSVPK